MLYRLKNFTQRRPLLFNSIIYGTFYTGAEFAQQTYTRVFKLSRLATNNPEESSSSISTHSGDMERRPILGWGNKFKEPLSVLHADVSVQLGNYNWAQLERYAIYGCLLAGPVLHGWYKWLDTFYKGKTMRVILAKLFADQFILTPPLIVMFFVSMSVMEGRSDVFGECEVKFLRTFKTSCMYWLPVQFLNFLLIPPVLRVTFVSIAAFCWVNILCYLKSVPLSADDNEKNKIEEIV